MRCIFFRIEFLVMTIFKQSTLVIYFILRVLELPKFLTILIFIFFNMWTEMYVIVTTNASAHQEGTAELRELPNTTIENR